MKLVRESHCPNITARVNPRIIGRLAILAILFAGLLFSATATWAQGSEPHPLLLSFTSNIDEEGFGIVASDSAAPSPSISSHIEARLSATTPRGSLSGFSSVTVQGAGNRVTSRTYMELDYVPDGLPGRVLFWGQWRLTTQAKFYILGPPRTPYACKVKARRRYIRTQNATYNWRLHGWAHPTWLFRWTHSTPEEELTLEHTGLSSDETVVIDGRTYSVIDPMPGMDPTGIVAFSNSNPPEMHLAYELEFEMEVDTRTGVPPVASYIPPATVAVQDVIPIESLSYDPDNDGDEPNKGIVKDEWEIKEPGGNKLQHLGRVLPFWPRTPGTYVIRLTSTDDEGMINSFEREIEVAVATVKFDSVNDENPFDPEVYFIVSGSLDDVTMKFDGRTFHLGPHNAGKHSFRPFSQIGFDAIVNKKMKHSLVVSGFKRGQEVSSDSVNFDNSPMLNQSLRHPWVVIWGVDSKGAIFTGRIIADLTLKGIRKWEWNLKGTQWDRLLLTDTLDTTRKIPLSTLVLTSTLPANERHEAFVSLTFFNVLFGDERPLGYAKLKNINLNPKNWSANYELYSVQVGKSGKTTVRLSLTGNSGDLRYGTLYWWNFPEGAPIPVLSTQASVDLVLK